MFPAITEPVYTPGIKSTALGRILHFESRMHKRLGLVRPQRYLRLWQYYAGTNLPPNNVDQPLGINYVKPICDKHTAFFWGETDDDQLIHWKVRPRRKLATPEDPIGIAIREYLDQLLEDNHGETLLWDAALNGSVYGDTIFRLRWDSVERRVVIENIQPEWFHCRWDTTDQTKLTEAIIAYPIDRQDAYTRYQTYGNEAIMYNMVNPDYIPGMGIYWEHWSPYAYQIWIDDCLVHSAPNPYMWTDDEKNVYPGVIPFVHIPNMRQSDFYGFGDAEMCLLLTDEIGRRMADVGDIVNNHAHPIVTLRQFHGDSEDLPVGPDAVWDLGLNGEADVLEAKGNAMATEYLDKLMTVLLDTAGLPEIAFGRQTRSNGRAQSSATALQLILMPAVERAKRKRVQWMTGLDQLARLAMLIQQVNQPEDLGFDFNVLANYTIRPVFGGILPRDRAADVNNNIGLTVNGLRSRKRALEDLGEEDIDAQILDIKADLQFAAALEMQMGGQNSDQGQGGSPGSSGPSAKTKPGKPVADGTPAASRATTNYDS